MVEYDSHHLRYAQKWYIKIVLITKDPKRHFLDINILVTIYLLSIMIGNKSTIHPANFNLHGILHKTTPNKIKIFPLKTLISPSNRVNIIIFIILIIFDIISNWSTCSWFDFENKWLTILIITTAIYLWT